ncbi:DNA translocase FtsK [Dissulfurirhabdus thermomarina]|uniref:DNA translocase FtsK n=1 Tax=Dissulfurirhabdus thermomarina TaxID=1765737 RepID=A0A6N9TSD0_DISTH|nr:DNA translocase FtsK [Dissulfurirhabdus thermomarina]NDY42357.1 DNA translocase FtsK [Dissulfurirhabdus thermomarina]NMX23015.1 DNA translocase FtsK [Dissulfurirhabdus thermomarina]
MPRDDSRVRTASPAGERPFGAEILGLCLVALALFTLAALASYSPDDPAWNHPSLHAARNWMGPVGAHLAAFLRDVLGYAAYWVPVLFVGLALRAGWRRLAWTPSLPWMAGGWAAVVLATAGLLGLGTLGDAAGAGLPGGLAGWALARFLATWFGGAGAALLLLVALVAGLLAATPLTLARAWALLAALAARRPEPAGAPPRARSGGRRPPAPAGGEAASVPHIATPRPLPGPAEEGGDTEEFKVSPVTGAFRLPPLAFLETPPPAETEIAREEYLANAQALERRLHDFGVRGQVVEICPGPVVTMYEFAPAPGVKINKVAALADDLALALKSASIRIVAPIPGKAVIGIELANAERETVFLKEILESDAFRRHKGLLPLALGKDIVGRPVVTDLARMPHLLIAGATGTGKSVGLNAMICSLLYRHRPDTLRLLMIDPKRIELSLYDGIPHLLHPVVSEPKEATRALRWAVGEMERRYRLLEEAGARNLEGYNRAAETPLPCLVIVIDELADLMMVSSKEVEASIARLAQMARAAGIHLLVATQRPSVDVLTGLIKANFPARLSFKVSSKVDSRTILDVMGAERLLGMGDMLLLPPGAATLERIHGAFVSEGEIQKIAGFLRDQGEPDYDPTVVEPVEGEGGEEAPGGTGGEVDALYDRAVELVTRSGQASISMVQRRLRVGYNRAARMIEQMERDGIVSPTDGMGRRQVLARGYPEE